MNKIKILGIMIFLLLLLLVVIVNYIDKQNKQKSNILTLINQQKDYTQEISKNIFYIYRNPNHPSIQLDKAVENFTNNLNKKDRILMNIKSEKIKRQSQKIFEFWKQYHSEVILFKNQIKVIMPYTNILLEETITRIYISNMSLTAEFDSLIKLHKDYFNESLREYKIIQYILFILISSLLMYLFLQVKPLLSFIQKFMSSANNIIQKNTISELEPINIKVHNKDIQNVANNFNSLVQNINSSIEQGYTAIDYTSNSLENIENNIEVFLILLNEMNDKKKIDIDMAKKEDAVIQSLEELMNIASKLKDLQSKLKDLIQHKK